LLSEWKYFETISIKLNNNIREIFEIFGNHFEKHLIIEWKYVETISKKLNNIRESFEIFGNQF